MALGTARQKQARPQQIAVRGGESDIVDENVVQRSLCQGNFPRAFAHASSKCEFGFNRKGLSWGAEFQLAVRYQPVYNPAPLPLPDKA
jgi:hypothetical protein